MADDPNRLSVQGIGVSEAAARVRAHPSDAQARVGLARLLALAGQWERVDGQLQAAARLDASSALYARVYAGCSRCERLRAEVFAGRRTPLVIGEPARWLALLVQALQALPTQASLAQSLIEQALEAAPAVAGRLDGEPFEWIADGDARLGPVLEVFADAKYYWVPFDRIERIAFEAPSDLIDTVWQSCEIALAGGASQSGFVPVRYPGSEASPDAAVALGRTTRWLPLTPTHASGLGQRVLITDRTERALLDCRELRMQAAA